ncbi:ATP-binding protein [Desulfatitalea alkaliphila]|uniref:ATP-binding protein n=1 Tax=Desulfatitalea alkaliphila TaxID=2929485 RepID=A0AA41R8I7_9BACT|nr:ATP-binding protein [Desulfatitalea alkaliphila]MCJ8503165.1 ATP-binding protein [Desulfatitalea alkaliphila]
MSNGLFGIERETIISNSKVRDIFTPFSPIDIVENLLGREKEVSQIVGVINSPGQHVLLYGDRGVGKTSLAIISHLLIKNMKIIRGKFFIKRCCSDDSFASIVQYPLKSIGIDYELSEITESHTQGGGAKIKAVIAEGGANSKRTRSCKRVVEINPSSPAWVSERLKDLKGVFLIDEIDALPRKNDKKRIAELIKLLSDSRSQFKLIVVGIADTGDELTAGHPSVERCLKETHLARMEDVALRNIIVEGMKKLQITPTEKVIDTIVDISAGYPHFTHLVCLKCAENAIVSKKRTVNMPDLEEALKDAVKESEGALKRRFESTLRGTKNEAEYRCILLAAAHCSIPEFTLSALRSKLLDRFNINIPQRVVSRYMSNMIVYRGKGVFDRVSKGVYRFSDPRMPSFIKMIEVQRSIAQ